MTREEAIAIFRAGEEATVAVLLQLSTSVEELKKRVEKLEEALGRKSTNSSNSSKPPSSDGFTKPPGKRKAQEGEPKRKPGGQERAQGRHSGAVSRGSSDQDRKIIPQEVQEMRSPLPRNPNGRYAGTRNKKAPATRNTSEVAAHR